MRNCNQWLPRRGPLPLHPVTRKEIFYKTDMTRVSYDEAQAIADGEGSANGVVFMMTHDDPYFFIDIDRANIDGKWSDFCNTVLGAFAGARIELSKSGNGLHIYGRSTSFPPHGCKNDMFDIECYTGGKAVSITGNNAVGEWEQDCTAALEWLIANYFPPKATGEDVDWSKEPRIDWSGPADDEELLAKAFSAVGDRVKLGVAASFGDLYEARVDKLAFHYPPRTAGKEYDGSDVDAAFAQHLAFWTGSNCERIERIMRGSKLMRAKWDDHEAYLEGTILRACGLQVDVYQESAPALPPVPGADEPAMPKTEGGLVVTPTMRSGMQYLMPTQQTEHFKGCVYVEDLNEALVPGGKLRDQQRFNVRYGGYIFALDTENDKTTKSAWEVFTQSQAIDFLRVDSVAFRPKEAPGCMFVDQGTSYVNTYHPADIRRAKGDASPFLDHLAKMLPVKRDYDLFLSYMAACIQHAGTKFQWAPVIQGVVGNGKGMCAEIVTHALGDKFCHIPKTKQLTGDFNGWLYGKLLILVDDISAGSIRGEVLDILKPMITDRRQEIQSKGVDQVTVPVCSNFLFTTNFKDAVSKDDDDRRWGMFFTAQQTKADCVRDGMTGDYFPKLWAWLREDGFAIMAEYLNTYAIPEEMNPASGQHAPVTSCTAEAIGSSLGTIEQGVVNAIEEHQLGFRGEWVSSVALNNLLNDLRGARIFPHNKRKDLMTRLGYERHPHLKNGRASGASPIDGGVRPTLYVKTANTVLMGLTEHVEILKAYTDAQNGLTSAQCSHAV